METTYVPGSLQTYRRKRRFGETPEPAGALSPGRGALRFVVQKHHASRLHYDFRLECSGTLKSWAVPKGPSLNPVDKRLAMMVEDHPLEYRTFEGIIPPGNYGAGTVIVWDEGTYGVPGIQGRRATESAVETGLAKGRLHIVLNGRKLQGEFILAKLARGEKNAWLFIKRRDAFASQEAVIEQDRSVTSGRTLEQVANQADRAWLPSGERKQPDLSDVPRGPLPTAVRPMLATLVDRPFDRKGWLFEIKWDGFRAIAEATPKRVHLYSRNQLSFGDRFAPVVDGLRKLGHVAVLDGEIVVLDAHGRSRFQLLQNYQRTGEGRLVYYVFDILHLDGHELRGLPLNRRKEILKTVLPELASVRLSEHIEERGVAFFKAAAAQGIEGVIAKDEASRYREAHRSKDWLKIKCRARQEAVIGGFTEPRGRRQDLGALILGVYDSDGELAYVGHTGGGFDDAGLKQMRKRLDPLIQKECPFREMPKANAPVRWVKPLLVCEVTFQEWTNDGRMRQPIFVGLREDKPAGQVRREKAVDPREPLGTSPRKAARRKRHTRSR